MTAPIAPLFTSEELAEQKARRESLVAALCSSEVVAFVGAGGSIGAGYPSWGRLVGKLTDHAKARDPAFRLPAAAAPVQLDAIRGVLGFDYVGLRQLALTQDVVGYLNRDPGPVQEFHRLLVRLPWRGILTTNYDLLLEKACAEAGGQLNRRSPRPAPICCHKGEQRLFGQALRQVALGGQCDSVLHLHGVIDTTGTIVCDSSEYAEAYGFDLFAGERFGAPAGASSPTLLAASVFSLLFTQRMFFLGFSLTDSYIEYVLKANADSTWSWGGTTHFALLPIDPQRADQDKAAAREILEAQGVAVIFYPCPFNRHAARDTVLQEIVEAVQAELAPVPAPVVPGPIVAKDAATPSPTSWISSAIVRFFDTDLPK